ncbi:MAG: glycosyltransferase family 4 protein [Fusobacteriaceae bacterium]
MKKILHMNHYYDKGGAETVFKQTYEFTKNYTKSYICHTDKNNFADVHLQAFEDSGFFKILNYVFNMKNFFKLRFFLKDNDLDIIHLHSYTAMSPSILLCLRLYKKKAKIIQTIHDYHIVCPNNSLYNFEKNRICEKCLGKKQKNNCFKEKCEKRGFFYLILKYISNKISNNIRNNNFIDLFLSPSEFLKNILIQDGIDEKKIIVVGNPINIQESKNLKKDNKIVYFGRLEKEKGVDEIIINFSKFLKKNQKFQLDIVGSGKEESDLKQIVKKLKIEENVSFLGKLNGENLQLQVSKSKISIANSSCYETFGLTPLESIIQNTIPIVRNSGATKEILDQVLNGLVFSNLDELPIYLEKVNSEYTHYFKKLSDSKNRIKKLNSKYFNLLQKIYLCDQKC